MSNKKKPYIKRRVYYIKRFVQHYPKYVYNVNELQFEIEWQFRDAVPEPNTVERWCSNKSLQKNIVVLRYMMSNAHLKGFVPTNMLDQIKQVKECSESVPIKRCTIKRKYPLETD